MKIIEALKGLKVIEKRMAGNALEISNYASYVSTERLAFDNEKAQRDEVRGRIQANEDLVVEYLKIKRALERTNLSTTIELDGKKFTICDLLVLKRRLGAFIQATYRALNRSAAENRLRNAPAIGDQRPQIVQLYDEAEKNSKLQKWQNLLDNIESRLEIINATTDLVE